MSNKIKRSVLIYYLHYSLFKNADREGKIQRKDIPSVFGRKFRIPKSYNNSILNELKDKGIIIDCQKDWVRVKKLKI